VTRRLGPEDGSLLVRTFREGVAAQVGHDLVLEVTRWEATVGDDAIALTADPRSLEVREGVRGVKPLGDRDRAEIRRNIDEKVLRGAPIAFRSSRVERSAGRLDVTGDLAIGAATRRVTVRLDEDGGRLGGTVSLRQTDWGITPYRGLMGALRVRDDVEVAIDVQSI
jgi:polyisoprenoid-binding protein YceI